jgi:hypothetical protein
MRFLFSGRVRFVVLLSVTLATLAVAGTASAGGSPVINETTVTRNNISVQPDTNPCTGAPAINSASGQETFHITLFADGTIHVIAAIHSDFLIDTIDPAGVDYSGHEADTSSFSGTNGVATGSVTFTFINTGTDGTHLVGHEVGHFTVTAAGDVTVSFDRFTLVRGCP